MDRLERFHFIHRQLRRPAGTLSLQAYMDEFEIGRATAFRDLAYMRDRIRAPICYDEGAETYRYDSERASTLDRFELPGFWMRGKEIEALRLASMLLEAKTTEAMHVNLNLLKRRLDIAQPSEVEPSELRIKVTRDNQYQSDENRLERLTGALRQRRRLRLEIAGRPGKKHEKFEVSPQRLIHLGGRWHLEAIRHDEDRIDAFVVDELNTVKVLDTKADDIDERLLQQKSPLSPRTTAVSCRHFAVVRFSAEVSVLERTSIWHDDQRQQSVDGGRLVRTIPYSDPDWLIRRIMEHGPDIEVLEPPELRAAVLARSLATVERHALS